MTSFSEIYRNRRVLITGHTGFKGSWLALWLKRMGADITGVALTPDTSPSHWEMLHLGIDSRTQDIRDAKAIKIIVQEKQPEIIFHLAAQPLVRRSYRDPLLTWETNVMGTANLLEACRAAPSVKAIVVITTDKCYENKSLHRGYREDDRLGGHDPYSASKAGAELVVASYRQSYFGVAGAPLIATARAGNVMGGGDWSEDRLIPDLARSVLDNKPLIIRSPQATRPWQHVLEPLAGYLMLGAKLLQGESAYAEAWNFGPNDDGNRSVEDVLKTAQSFWPAAAWQVSDTPQPHEAQLLHLDSSKARERLGWKPVWNFDASVAMTVEWYKNFIAQQSITTERQLEDYLSLLP